MEAARRNSWFVLQPKPDKCMQQLGMPSINFHEVLHKKYIYVYSILGQHTLLWAEDEYGLASSEHFFYCFRWCSTKLNYYHHSYGMAGDQTRAARNQLITCLHTYRQIRQGNRVFIMLHHGYLAQEGGVCMSACAGGAQATQAELKIV